MARLYEYQGKALLKEAGLTVPRGEVASTPDEAYSIAEKIGGPVVVKSQVWTTGRFKAGGIKFAESPEQAREEAAGLFGKRIKGFKVEKLLIEEQLELEHEFYKLPLRFDVERLRREVAAFEEGDWQKHRSDYKGNLAIPLIFHGFTTANITSVTRVSTSFKPAATATTESMLGSGSSMKTMCSPARMRIQIPPSIQQIC